MQPVAVQPTGQERWDAMTPAEQDEAIGPELAQLVRDGKVTLADLVTKDGAFIRGKTVADLNLSK